MSSSGSGTRRRHFVLVLGRRVVVVWDEHSSPMSQVNGNELEGKNSRRPCLLIPQRKFKRQSLRQEKSRGPGIYYGRDRRGGGARG
jgi:hypothetical protein